MKLVKHITRYNILYAPRNRSLVCFQTGCLALFPTQMYIRRTRKKYQHERIPKHTILHRVSLMHQNYLHTNSVFVEAQSNKIKNDLLQVIYNLQQFLV